MSTRTNTDRTPGASFGETPLPARAIDTYSRMFATASLLNWFRFLTLRSAPDAQYEIRVYADAMLELIRPIAPVAVAAWEKV